MGQDAAEEEAARDYIAQAGYQYQVLDGCTYEQPILSVTGKTLTETRYGGLNERADKLVQFIFNQLKTD